MAIQLSGFGDSKTIASDKGDAVSSAGDKNTNQNEGRQHPERSKLAFHRCFDKVQHTAFLKHLLVAPQVVLAVMFSQTIMQTSFAEIARIVVKEL